MTTQEMDINLQEIVAEWKDKEGNLIMVLHQIQNKLGYVPRDLSLEISKLLDVPLARIYEVITFYHFFKLEKPGKHIISVCTGTACYLKGADQLIDGMKKRLNISPGETTADKEFHMQDVRCLGCCSLAPVVTVDTKVHAKVEDSQIDQILEQSCKS